MAGGRGRSDAPRPRRSEVRHCGDGAPVRTAVVLLLALLVAGAADLRAQEPDVIAAAEAGSGVVYLLDGRCWGEAARLGMGGEVHQLSPSPDGSHAFVAHATDPSAAGRPGTGPSVPAAGRGGEPTGQGAVTVLDLREGRAVRRFSLGRTGDVTDVWSSDDGGRIWVAAERGGRVLTLDSDTGELLMEWTIGRTSSQEGVASRDGRYLYVTNREAGSLTVIDRVTVAANTVALDRGAGSVTLGPSGRAWVADRDDDRLWVVDGRAGSVEAEMASGGSRPLQVLRRPGANEVWVLHGGGGGLQVFDTYRRTRTAAVAIPGRPRAMRFSEDGGRILVTVPGRGQVVTVDAEERRVEAVAGVPLRPGSLAWRSCPDGGCRSDGATWRKGAVGLPGDDWTEADWVGDLWCGSGGGRSGAGASPRPGP